MQGQIGIGGSIAKTKEPNDATFCNDQCSSISSGIVISSRIFKTRHFPLTLDNTKNELKSRVSNVVEQYSESFI